jgi:hypothetical protein
MTHPSANPVSEIQARRVRVRRSALLLAAVAVAVYLGFIVSSVLSQ